MYVRSFILKDEEAIKSSVVQEYWDSLISHKTKKNLWNKFIIW